MPAVSRGPHPSPHSAVTDLNPAVRAFGPDAEIVDDLARRYNHAPIPGKDPVYIWAAIGDSFSAGPGAGQPYPDSDKEACRRRTGAYAPQMERSNLFTQSYNNPHFDFRSCTGYLSYQVDAEQVPYVSRDTELVTLSIGGNECVTFPVRSLEHANTACSILFVPILTACVFNRFGDCDGKIAESRRVLYGEDFHRNYTNLIADTYQRLGWVTRSEVSNPRLRTAVYQTSYPPFFDSWTGQCNNVRFISALGSKLSNDLRDKLNLLGQELNYVLSMWIDRMNYFYTGGGPADRISFIKFADQDERYNGHRFCRDGVEEPSRNNPDTWFFNIFSNRDDAVGVQSADATVNASAFARIDAATCDYTANTINEFGDTLPCIFAKEIANCTGSDCETVFPAAGESTQKTFHPRIAGFSATSDEVQQRLTYELPQNGGGPARTDLRIMAIGDSRTVGIGGNGFSESYRRKLYDILMANSGNTVQFVGTQVQGPNRAWNRIEGYIAATVSTIQARLQANNAIRTAQPNVVLLLAGAQDVLNAAEGDYNALNRTRNQLDGLVDHVFSQCENCVLLLAHIPPYGLWNFQWPPTRRQQMVIQFNAMISEIVNKKRTLNGYKILKVHTTASNSDLFNDEFPNQRGYEKIAYDWAERLSDAWHFNWIEPPVIVPFNATVFPTGSLASSSPTAKPTTSASLVSTRSVISSGTLSPAKTPAASTS